MNDRKDEKLNTDDLREFKSLIGDVRGDGFSLDDILSEYGSGQHTGRGAVPVDPAAAGGGEDSPDLPWPEAPRTRDRRDKVVAFRKSFHGRTSGAVAVTDNPKIVSPFNAVHKVSFCELNDIAAVEAELSRGDVAAVIIEGIQGCGGINMPEAEFMQQLSVLCRKFGTVLVLDEVQSGYGRTGRFFAHQWYGIRPDIITMGKGIANGFPCGGILISPEFQAVKGMLGTTFGGNYLAMAAAIAVLDIMEKENLVANALEVGEYLKASIPASEQIREVRGRGLMLGIEFNGPVAELRRRLLFEKHIFTGVAGSNMVRLLAPLCLTKAEAEQFVNSLKDIL